VKSGQAQYISPRGTPVAADCAFGEGRIDGIAEAKAAS